MVQICRRWNLIASVFALTVSNVLLTVYMLHKSDCAHRSAAEAAASAAANTAADSLKSAAPIPHAPPLPTATPCVAYVISDQTNHSDRPIFSALNLNTGRWDARRLYKLFDYAVTGDRFVELSANYSVCLATQSSLEKLYSLVQVAHHWTGPISAAVFAAGNDELYLLQLYLTYLRKCFAPIRDRVSVHLAVPRHRAPSQQRTWLDVQASQFDCGQPERTLLALLKYRTAETSKWRLKNPYPQNHLRNVARKGCQTDQVFLVDVDIVPSIGFADQMDAFLRISKRCATCAYVIPTYELDPRAKFPVDKADLIRLGRKGLARPFHHKVFIYNQFATNISRWEAEITSVSKPGSPKSGVEGAAGAAGAAAPTFRRDPHVSHNVTNFEFFYEPFYVASDLVPAHDERFLGYGFTRNTQVYEMFLAGYQFQVLSPLFTCHWGMQNGKNPPWRERQNSANRKQFDVFKREVFARYQKDPLKMIRGGLGAGIRGGAAKAVAGGHG